MERHELDCLPRRGGLAAFRVLQDRRGNAGGFQALAHFPFHERPAIDDSHLAPRSTAGMELRQRASQIAGFGRETWAADEIRRGTMALGALRPEPRDAVLVRVWRGG